MLWIRKYKPQPLQRALYKRALIITICGNVLLAVSKGLVAHYSGSVALFADAANSVSDVIYSVAMMIGLWLALQPPDISHPQGHSRFEPLVGMVVTFSMAFAGFEAERASLERFLAGGQAVENGLPTLVLLASAIVKAGMFYVISRIARQLSSPTLATTAKDNLSDVLTSVAAFIGVIGSKYFNPILDPVAGLAVAAWIFRAAFMAGKENLGFLTGAGASEELRKRIVEAAESVPGVLRVHHTMTEYVGPRLLVDLHVNVEGSRTLIEAHAICDHITEKLEEFSEIDRAYVHVEPDDWV
jgi:cation diffusion facilitator family transporter